MTELEHRRPFALANWKMAMTIEEERRFVGRFFEQIGELADRADIVLCPPNTALYGLSLAIGRSKDMHVATRELVERFYSDNPDYLLTPEIVESVYHQMLRHIVKKLENL